MRERPHPAPLGHVEGHPSHLAEGAAVAHHRAKRVCVREREREREREKEKKRKRERNRDRERQRKTERKRERWGGGGRWGGGMARGHLPQGARQ